MSGGGGGSGGGLAVPRGRCGCLPRRGIGIIRTGSAFHFCPHHVSHLDTGASPPSQYSVELAATAHLSRSRPSKFQIPRSPIKFKSKRIVAWRGVAAARSPPLPCCGAPTRCSSSSASSRSNSNLFVGGLSYDTNETALKDAFSQYGGVVAVKVICHPTTSKSKGFGFVKFSSQNQAAAALKKMDGQELDGRNIRVHYANGTGGSAQADG